jgi:hypothetical protein
MESKFSFLATGRTNEELRERIDNRQKYLPETVEASVAELQFRKHEFSDEELKVIGEDLQAHRANAATISSRIGFWSGEYKNALVEDPDAPLLYSRLVIYTFSFFLGALFGSIMMAMNLGKLGKRKDALYAILFGVGFTAVQIYLSATANSGPGGSYGILGGIIAAVCLDFFFWKFHIGYETFYRARPFGVPLTIGILIGGLIIGLLMLAMYNTRF